MRCVDVKNNGSLVATNAGTCTGSQYVLLTQSELDQHLASPFRLSLAEGATVAGAVLLVWATAYGFKAAARALSSGDPE